MADSATTCTHSTTKHSFYVKYTARDAILYALSIGFGSTETDYEHDLRYLYEDHADFQVAPMFGLTLIFWALQDNETKRNATTLSIPQFPPPMMKSMQVIPKAFLRPPSADDSLTTTTLQDCPVIHMFQSIEWHRPLPTPSYKNNGHHTTCTAELKLQGKFRSIEPKSIGTFVSTELAVFDASSGKAVCTLQSTALVFGMPANQVLSYQDKELSSPSSSPPSSTTTTKTGKRGKNAVLWFETSPICVATNQALWYRMASGDSNHIHVDPSALPPMLLSSLDETDSPKPLLHGLCTLGIAGRVIMQQLTREYSSSSSVRDVGDKDCSSQQAVCLQRLQGAFAKPVFVQDEIYIKVWKQQPQKKQQQRQEHHVSLMLLEIYFEVHNATRKEIAVRDGYLLTQISSSLPSRL